MRSMTRPQDRRQSGRPRAADGCGLQTAAVALSSGWLRRRLVFLDQRTPAGACPGCRPRHGAPGAARAAGRRRSRVSGTGCGRTVGKEGFVTLGRVRAIKTVRPRCSLPLFQPHPPPVPRFGAPADHTGATSARSLLSLCGEIPGSPRRSLGTRWLWARYRFGVAYGRKCRQPMTVQTRL